MKTITTGVFAAVIGAGMLGAVPAAAIDSSAWLQRQFSTDHRDYVSAPGAAADAKTASGARSEEDSGLDFASAWLKRQLAGEPMPSTSVEGLAGRAGPIDGETSGAALSDAWLRRQFTTDHPDPAR